MDQPFDCQQYTLSEELEFVGVGLHSGLPAAARIVPAPPGHGIRFANLSGGSDTGLLASWRNVTATNLCTTLGNGAGRRFATVEHLLAALHGHGVDNALVEVRGGELPILDGSARPYVQRLRSVQRRAQPASRQVLVVEDVVGVSDGDRFVMAAPSPWRRLTAEIDFRCPIIGRQRRSICLDRDSFTAELASARTFGFAEDLDLLHREGLAKGGSWHNAIVLRGDRVLNPEGLRFDDEFVRHKLLDLVGDVSLAGLPVVGHVFGHRPGHALNTELVKALLTEPGAVSLRRIEDRPPPRAADPIAQLLARPDVSGRGVWSRLLGQELEPSRRSDEGREDCQ